MAHPLEPEIVVVFFEPTDEDLPELSDDQRGDIARILWSIEESDDKRAAIKHIFETARLHLDQDDTGP